MFAVRIIALAGWLAATATASVAAAQSCMSTFDQCGDLCDKLRTDQCHRSCTNELVNCMVQLRLAVREEAARLRNAAAAEVARITSARPCEIPGYPNAHPDEVPGMGFAWCPAEVEFQVRSYAIAAAGTYCAKLAGDPGQGDPGQDWAAQLAALCDGLDDMDRLRDGDEPGCACPDDMR